MRMDSTEKMNELMTLLDMNNHLSNNGLTGIDVNVNDLLDDRIRIVSDQLISGKYTDTMQKNEKRVRWIKSQ